MQTVCIYCAGGNWGRPKEEGGERVRAIATKPAGEENRVRASESPGSGNATQLAGDPTGLQSAGVTKTQSSAER